MGLPDGNTDPISIALSSLTYTYKPILSWAEWTLMSNCQTIEDVSAVH